ncbi:MAG TPA: hypothetical protein PLP50_17705 [Thermoanaerobaculia bacterium]|nr:hypothetical protein [Thermoanaerobaculia bacterium]HQP89059.1 hypothetical protein [Thermoanaerobaculia bacterium]
MAETDTIARLTRERDEAREACRLIDLKIGHFGSAPEPPQDMPMLWLLWYAGRTARAALREEGK